MLPVGMAQTAAVWDNRATGVSQCGARDAATARNTGTIKVAPYAARRGPQPRNDALGRRRVRKASPAAISYPNTGTSASETAGAIRTSHTATAKNATQPTMSDQCRRVEVANASSCTTSCGGDRLKTIAGIRDESNRAVALATLSDLFTDGKLELQEEHKQTIEKLLSKV